MCFNLEASGFGVMKAFPFIPIVTLESNIVMMGHGINIKLLIVHNRQKLGGLYRVLHNFALDSRPHRHILMAVLQSSLEYDCEVWYINKYQAKALESIQLCACKYILWCSITTCDEPVLADFGFENFKMQERLS